MMATDSLRKTDHTIPEELFEGNRLDQPIFHRLYEQTPPDFKAELIGGVVRLPLSRVPVSHGWLRILGTTWLGTYAGATPEAHALFGATILLGEDSEPQPDICLRYREGTSHESNDFVLARPS